MPQPTMHTAVLSLLSSKLRFIDSPMVMESFSTPVGEFLHRYWRNTPQVMEKIRREIFEATTAYKLFNHAEILLFFSEISLLKGAELKVA